MQALSMRAGSKLKNKPLLHSAELSAVTRLEGDLKSGGSLLVKGHYEGTLDSSSHVTIDREAVVESCTLSAKSLSIFGRFSGTIRTEGFVEIQAKASVSAGIEASRVEIAETAHFEGQIRMPGAGD
ncbi:MAG: polymer-forming cytoskeletal protein [Rectinemataceae bacterium]|nr:polymer-forming cytoskeletal protein [Rectinemataceae bacterium]